MFSAHPYRCPQFRETCLHVPLNLKLTLPALLKFERDVRPVWIAEQIGRRAGETNALCQKFADNPADNYSLLLTLAGQIASDLALKARTNLDRRVVLEFARVLISARRDDRDLESRQFAREKWEFDISEACLAKLPELKLISTDSALTQKEKLRRIRLRLFGVAPD